MSADNTSKQSTLAAPTQTTEDLPLLKDPNPKAEDIEDDEPTPKMVYLNAFFFTIAAVLGVGILALPVKLSKAGYAPFVVSYGISFLVQCCLMVYIVDILQRGRVFDKSQAKSVGGTEEKDPEVKDKAIQAQNLDLHTLGEMYLSKIPLFIFDFNVMTHFITILISYGLAGSSAYASFFEHHASDLQIEHNDLIAPFILILTLLVLLGQRFIAPVVSVMTFGKGGILFLMVIITGIIGINVNLSPTDSWRYIGKPFLIGTVALGGSVNIIPVVFGKVKMKRRDIKLFLLACLLGLLMVWVLNIVWCYFVLLIVPQTGTISLAEAEKEGQQATKPLVDIINQDYKDFTWTASLITVFIMVSISVSFVVMSMGTRHVLDGLIGSWKADHHSGGNVFQNLWRKTTRWPLLLKKGLVYSLCWGSVLLVALLNPKGFIFIMEKVTSLGLNIEAGLFVVWMLITARKQSYGVSIPFEVPTILWHLRYVVGAYFVFAIVYDFATIIAEFGFDYHEL